MQARRTILITTLLVGMQWGSSGLPPGAWAQPGGVTAVPAVPPDTGMRARLQSLLPVGGISAQVLVPRSRLAVLQIQERVARAGGDLRVLANVLGEVEQGNLGSYDERLNIPRTEFQSLLVFQRTLAPAGKTVRLAVTQSGSKLSFADSAGTGILKGLSIDMQSGELSTQDGFVARPKLLQTPPTQDPTGLGPGVGVSWDIKGSNPRTLNALQGHLSLLQYSGGQVLLSYSRVSIIKAHISEDMLNLLYRK